VVSGKNYNNAIKADIIIYFEYFQQQLKQCSSEGLTNSKMWICFKIYRL